MKYYNIKGLFTHSPIIYFETQRLIFRSISMLDARDIYAYASKPETSRYVLWEPHRSIRDTRRHIKALIQSNNLGACMQFAAVLRQTGHVIGTIGFTHLNSTSMCAQIGYSFSPDYHHQGLATQAVKGLVEFGFNTLSLHRIEAEYIIENAASARVLEKCGFLKEGALRERVFKNNQYYDTMLCSILSNKV